MTLPVLRLTLPTQVLLTMDTSHVPAAESNNASRALPVLSVRLRCHRAPVAKRVRHPEEALSLARPNPGLPRGGAGSIQYPRAVAGTLMPGRRFDDLNNMLGVGDLAPLILHVDMFFYVL